MTEGGCDRREPVRRPCLPEVGTTEGESLALPNVLIDCRRALVLIAN